MGIFNFQGGVRGASVGVEENTRGIDFSLDLG
jgi:hypothetical protein